MNEGEGYHYSGDDPYPLLEIDPTLSLSYMAGSSELRPLTFLQLPVLLGYNLSERNQVEFSPQLMMAMPHLGVSARQFIPSLGVAFLHRFESGWGVLPELTAIAPPDVDGTPFRELAFQANFSVLKR